MKNESKKSEKITAQKSKSTRSSESHTARKRLCNENCSDEEKLKEAETTQAFEAIEGTPFTYTYVKGNRGMITMCNMAISPEEFDNIDEAKKYLDKKPWEVILIAGEVYRMAVKTANEQAKSK